jgi:hypothetical protein
MNLIEQFKAQNPEYADRGDVELATALHRKFYADLPIGEFYQKAGVTQAPEDPTGSFTENIAAGMGAGMTRMARGAQQALGVGDQQALVEREAEARRLDAPLRGTAGGVIGDIVGTAALTAPAALVPGANTVAGAALIGGALGTATPVLEDESRLGNVATGAAGGAVAQFATQTAMRALKDMAVKRATEMATRRLQNAPRDAAIDAAKQAGYIVQPREVNAESAINTVLEGVSGKIQTGQAVAVKNQEVTNALARKALGLPEDAPLNYATIDKVRKNLGQVYEALRGAGEFVPDQRFINKLQEIGQESDRLAARFPSMAKPQVAGVIEDFARPDPLPSDVAVDALKSLYEDAAGNLKFSASNEQKALGRAQRKIAEELQDLIERNLKGSDADGLLTAFKAARKQYAQAMGVRRAVKEGTGSVVASKLGQQLNSGSPLSGDLRTIAEFSNVMPRATQVPTYQPGFSAADFLFSVPTSAAGYAAGGAPGALLGLVGPAARAGARRVITSPMYQGSALTNPNYSMRALEAYGPNLLRTLAPVSPALGAQLGLSQTP